jgi:hypothetical protein
MLLRTINTLIGASLGTRAGSARTQLIRGSISIKCDHSFMTNSAMGAEPANECVNTSPKNWLHTAGCREID